VNLSQFFSLSHYTLYLAEQLRHAPKNSVTKRIIFLFLYNSCPSKEDARTTLSIPGFIGETSSSWSPSFGEKRGAGAATPAGARGVLATIPIPTSPGKMETSSSFPLDNLITLDYYLS
jgi:hypothetical protein